MKLGVFTVGMPEYSPQDTVRILKEIGYHGVEWRVGDGVPSKKPDTYTFQNRYWSYNRSTLNIKEIDQSAQAIKTLCHAAGLEVCSLTTYTKPWDTENIERALKAAGIMECRRIRVTVPSYDGKENYCQLFDRTRKQISVLEKMAKNYGVRINFEQHMNTIIPSASASYRLVSGFDPEHIGIIFDPGNMVYEGFENYQLTIELLGEYIGHVHLKNACWKQAGTRDDGSLEWKPDWDTLKNGYADIRKVLTLLKDKGYNGYVCLEDFSNEADTETKLKESYQFISDIINEQA